MVIKEIEKIDSKIMESLLNIWERSVKISHLFLTKSEIEEIKKYVPLAINNVSNLIVIFEADVPLGFLGVSNKKIEMLFIDSSYLRKGLGTLLINYAFEKYNVNEVVVNEQNPKAHSFYLKCGFKDVLRKEFDEQGNPYPIIIMKK